MPAVKSKNRTHVAINQNFIIAVKKDNCKKAVLTTARKLNQHLKDIKLNNKLFKQVLQGKTQVYTFRARKCLTIKFYSK